MSEKELTLLQMKQKLAMTANFIETLLDEVGDAVYYQDSDLKYRFFNDAYLAMVNKREEEVKGHDIYNVFPKEEAEYYHKDDLNVLASGKRKSYETSIEHPNGDKIIIQVIKRPHINREGEIVGIFGIIKDVTEIREKKRQLNMLDQVKKVFLDINRRILSHKSEQDFFDAIQMEIQSVFKPCKQSTVLKVSEKEEISILVHRGYLADEVHDFHMPLSESYFYRYNSGRFDHAFYVNDVLKYMSDNGVPIVASKEDEDVRSSLCIPLMHEDQLKYIISLDSNIHEAFNETDRLVAEFISQELPIIYRVFDLHLETLKLSKYDELTGLYNRRNFNKASNTIIAALEEGQQFCMVIIDIDRLKRVNDQYGHQAGDNYITTLAGQMKALESHRIKFGRIGGDEFIGYFKGYDYDQVVNMMDNLRKEFSSTLIASSNKSFQGSFSYGVASYGTDGDKRSVLMKVADLRMYENKHKSRKDG